MVAINDGDGWVSVTRPETTDIALGGNETDFPGKFFRELASRDKFVYDRTNLIPGRNKIINGNFDIWQRDITFSPPSHQPYHYTADRWCNGFHVSSLSTVTRQDFALGQTDVPGNPRYYCRVAVTSGGTASSFVNILQRIEDVRTFQGQTVTVSFWAKADATKPVCVGFVQNFGTGGSPSAKVEGIGATKLTLTTSWAKYTVTVSIPSITGKTLGSDGNNYLTLVIWFEAGSDYDSRTDTLGLQSGTFDIAKVQVELGSNATTFEELPLATQFDLCLRYYGNNGGVGYVLYGNSIDIEALASLALPTPMRTIPTVTVVYDNSSNCTFTIVPLGPTCIVGQGTPTSSGVITYLSVRVSVDAEL